MKTCSKCKTDKSCDNFRSVKPGKGCKLNLHSWCRECERVARRKHYADNPEKYKDWNKQWNEANPERRRELERTRDRLKKSAAYKNWAANNKDKLRAYDHNYRARLRNAEGVLTSQVILSVLATYGELCLKCGSTKNIEIDHVVPLSRGGTNLFDNLQPLCKSCNSGKGGRNDADYRPQGRR